MPAINIDPPGASENALCPLIHTFAQLDHDPPPRRLARPFARRAMLQACAIHTARQFARAIIMPNLRRRDQAEAVSYRERSAERFRQLHSSR